MSSRLIAIALDAADWPLIGQWTEQGLLPNLKHFIAGGSVRALSNHPLYRNEHPWVSLLTGCSPEKTGYWTPLRYHARTYRMSNAGPYSFQPCRPFFALASGRRVTQFDLPHCGHLFAEADGVQVIGWGAHSPMGGSQSLPDGLFAQLRRRFGTHPAFRIQNGGSWWDVDRLQRLRSALLEGIRRRSRIHRALLAEHPADLTVLSFSEIHIASHHFWHLSDRAHPLYGRLQPMPEDFLLEIYQATDQAVGELLEGLPAGINALLFSPEGGTGNWCDLNSMVFLPELMFRWNFPGRSLFFGPAAAGTEFRPRFNDWVRTLWSEYYGKLPPPWIPARLRPLFGKIAGLPGCNFPMYAMRRLGALQWQPPSWYRPWWPRMKAFALPSYGDGYIRINLKDREPHGTVSAAEYDGLCRELSVRLKGLCDARSGAPVVEDVVIIMDRMQGIAAGQLPDADLVVRWRQSPNDMIADATVGNLGPAPFWKAGSHRPMGFVVGSGPGIARGTAPVPARVIDLAPTILQLLGIPPPGHLDGRPLFS